jgi:hypothetical protein
MNIKEEA